MSHEEFKPDDIFINRIKSHPKLNFFINDSEVTIGYHQNLSASNNFALNVPKGYLSLYEMNINRDEKLIYPFLYNGGIGAKGTFRQQLGNPIVAERTSQSDLCGGQAYLPDYDQPQAGSYPMSASIVRVRTNGNTIFTGYGEDCTDIITLPSYNINKYLSSLQNVAKKYTPLSGHFILSSSVYRPTDLTKTSVNMIDIPSIFYGSSLKKGSVTLSYYISGSLIAEASDIKRNGELIETTGSSTGTVVGIVMYDEGIMLLTASHELSDNSSTIQYGTGAPQTNQWIYFGTGCNDGAVGSVTDHIASASFNISCQGTSYLNSMTLFCHSRKGEHTYSNNPTFIDSTAAGTDIGSFSTSSYSYSESPLPLKNIVSSSFLNYSASYEKTSYLSKVGIYDKKGNLIMVATVANPVKKTNQDEYTFKLTLDI